MKITYYGHATLLCELEGKSILFDPFISGNPKAPNKDISFLNPDYILVSHGHQDHVLDVEAIASNNDSLIISNYEISTWFGAKGLKTHPLNHGGKKTLDFGTVKYVNAIHTSVLPDGTNGGNPGGFVLWSKEKSLYFAGDTALTMDMKLIPMTCPKLDLAILPIGDNFTMGYEDAALAAEFVDCDRILGCHFDTFGYIEIDKQAAIDHFKSKGKELILLDFGESIEI